jgi:hypothetical protein
MTDKNPGFDPERLFEHLRQIQRFIEAQQEVSERHPVFRDQNPERQMIQADLEFLEQEVQTIVWVDPENEGDPPLLAFIGENGETMLP